MKKKGTIRNSLLILNVVPIILIGIAVMVVGFIQLNSTIKYDVRDELKEISYVIAEYYNGLSGDYKLQKNDGKEALENDEEVFLYKGAKNLTNDEYVNIIKDKTDLDISLFYGSIRVATTLTDSKDESIIYTEAPMRIKNDVYASGNDMFYSNVKIDKTLYFAYYIPLDDSFGNRIGMIGIAKNSGYVKREVVKSVIPLVIVPLVFMVIAIFINGRYSSKFITDIRNVRKYMKEVSEHNFNASLAQSVYDRNDELYDIGKSTTDMKNALRKLIEQDALTGLHNRRFGEVQFKNVYEKMREQQKSFSIVMCDIDFFKKINDTYGHEAGDEVLKMVASKLQKGTSEFGFAIRWGGEEFLLCFTNCDSKKTHDILSEVLDDLRNTVIEYGEYKISVTMTFGIVEGDLNKSVDELIKEADDKLYEGKKTGRNRIIS